MLVLKRHKLKHNVQRNLFQKPTEKPKNKSEELPPKKEPKKKFTCEKCSYWANSLSHLKDHFKSTDYKENKRYSCEKCNFVSCTAVGLNRHAKKGIHESALNDSIKFLNETESNHDDDEPDEKSTEDDFFQDTKEYKKFSCDKCDCKFGFNTLLESHKNSKSYRKNRNHACKRCGFLSCTTLSLKKHVEVECSKKKLKKNKELTEGEILPDSETVSCDQCDSIFHDVKYDSKVISAKDNFYVHKKSTGYKEGHKKSCENCNFISCTKHGLKVHLKSEHNINKISKCDRCDMTFDGPGFFHAHQKNKGYNKDQKNSCEFCDYVTCTKRGLNKHIESKHQTESKDETQEPKESKEDSINCDKCDKRFSVQSSFQKHQKNKGYINGHQHKCKFCDFVVCTKVGLNKHIEEKHENESLENLKESSQDHPNESQDFKCDKCSIVFSDQNGINLHKKSKGYQKDSKIPCANCDDITFCTTRSLSKHHDMKQCERSSSNNTIIKNENLTENADNRQKKSYNNGKVKIESDTETIKCDKCDVTFQEIKYESRSQPVPAIVHYKVHQKSQGYKQGHKKSCQFCDFSSCTNHGLKIHKKSKHNTNDDEPVTNAVTENDENLVTGVTENQKESSKSGDQINQEQQQNMDYFCENCDFPFKSKDDLLKHNNISKMSQFNDSRCDICDITYKSEDCLKKHSLITHERKFVCDKCYFPFDEEIALSVHTNSEEYKNGLRVSCEKCEFYICNKNGLSFHIQNVHGGQNNESTSKISIKSENQLAMAEGHECTSCGKIFKKKGNLKNHKCKSEQQAENITEDKNNEDDNVVKNLENVKNEGKELVCDKCSCSFKTLENLQTHQKSKEYSENTKYDCDTCESQSCTVASLVQHKILLHGLKYHKCNFCDKKFITPKFLETHINECHTNSDEDDNISEENFDQLELYKCAVCNDIEFQTYFDFKAHTITLHLDMELAIEIPKIDDQLKGHLCGECGKIFVKRTSLKSHLSNEHGQEDLSDNDGDETNFDSLLDFESNSNFESEIDPKDNDNSGEKDASLPMSEVNDEEENKCDSCDKFFVSPQSLKAHILNQHTTNNSIMKSSSNQIAVNVKQESQEVVVQSYLDFDLDQDPQLIADQMVDGVNVPGKGMGGSIDVDSSNLPKGLYCIFILHKKPKNS